MITGLPIELTIFIRDLLGIDTFIETGTGLGHTTGVASGMFEHVYTIEAHKGRWQEAYSQFEATNINFILGESPGALADVLEDIDHRQCVVFLDAHCGYRELVTDHACPLLAEIDAVLSSNKEHVIIIDDQHAFTSVPHNLKHRDHYPELPQVIDMLGFGDPYIVIEGKAIVSMPRSVKRDVDIFLHKVKFGDGG